MPSGPISAPVASKPDARMPGCARIFGCWAAFSAIPSAIRKARTFSTCRAHPADLDPVPSRRRQACAARTGGYPRQYLDRRPSASCAHSAISRTWRISPRTRTTFARCARARSPAARRRTGTLAGTLAQRATAGITPRLAQILQESAGLSGADRASDRSAPQNHDRSRNGNRRTARSPRADEDDGGGNEAATSSCGARC